MDNGSYKQLKIKQEINMAGRQGFEPRSDGPEPPVLPLDDLPALKVIVEKGIDSFKTKRSIL
jgi:hypothetical protein